MSKKIAIIGSGFSGLSSAAYLAKEATKFMCLKKQ
jgi:glycine/D-amino acid oxidase-like deaminating enzyme